MTSLRIAAGLMIAIALSGCTGYSGGRSNGFFFSRNQPRIKPVMAVMDFENKASFSGQWNLGQGMADLLIAELVDTRRVEVLERKYLDEVLGELDRQGNDLFRKEGRVERGRLKSAQYLVRGIVTDFTVTGDSSGWFGVSAIRVGGRGQRARVAIAIRVSDVASGQVVSAAKAEAEVSSGGFGAAVNYKGVSFGGDAFFRTPLGKATEKAIYRAVGQVLADLPARAWEPRVAEAGPDTIVISGGREAGVREGAVYNVRGAPRTVTDPVTGNVIGEVPGPVQGRLKVVQVEEMSAYAKLEQGIANRGDYLEIVE